MQLIPGVEVVAVAAGSSKEKAEGFAKEHGEQSMLLCSKHGLHLKQGCYTASTYTGSLRTAIALPLRPPILISLKPANSQFLTLLLMPPTKLSYCAGVKHAYGSYEDLAKDPEVDLVYIANLHPQHKDTVLTMTKHKKNILCEKPLSVNRKETQAMVDAAKEADVFFMAGLWSRFFPAQKL